MYAYGKFFLKDDEKVTTEEFKEEYIKYGKSLYEVIKVQESTLLFLEKHLQRLHNSGKLTGLEIFLNDEIITKRLKELISINKVEEGSIKFVLNFDEKLFVAYFEQANFPKEHQYKEGVKTDLFYKERINPNAKVLNLSFREEVDKFIKEKHIYEAILVDKDGYITEGSKSNVFLVKGEKLYTTPIAGVLPGITRSTIMDICSENNINIIEESIKAEELNSIKGAFLSSTPFDVLPINEIGNNKLNSAENAIVKYIMECYNNKILRYIDKNK
ncbi:aminotransferase class IV [Clostridium peptidivorans]|uniref:aminotransferase class IV n=1 Tax=Clostridium peptidivorans TaxID=100174 RepID=UPI000BE2BE86|nr:aminotransferase class IV [Clostridium peptidivorans]